MATVALVLAALLLVPAGAELTRVEHAPKAEGSLAILAVGDWGRRGQFNQTLVAEQMGVVGEKLDIDFVISTGDNIYDDGIANTSDPLFKESFSNIYTAQSLQTPWYIVLGNHDYTGNALAQQDAAIREVDSRYLSIAKSFIVNSEIADFFLVDTTPFYLKYWNSTKYDWREVSPRDTYIENLLKDLDDALTQSEAAWKIVVGHHPISSGCEHGNTTELEQLLRPVLEAHEVDMYVNGHDHCLQRISSRDSPLEFLTSGGGSKAWAGKFKATSDKVEFLYDGQGFMSIQLSKTEAHFAFYDVAGSVLHSWDVTKTAEARY
ncbi:purple acid phosphatase 4-like [Phragmites australis]|uniref:purple acid phosphatase 4-like n=1 Tax=Phragmites australis TaxID=29695 RepID=UPI002D771AAB|nr:purple acid phosphatase 4-like [Phragmites australis]